MTFGHAPFRHSKPDFCQRIFRQPRDINRASMELGVCKASVQTSQAPGPVSGLPCGAESRHGALPNRSGRVELQGSSNFANQPIPQHLKIKNLKLPRIDLAFDLFEGRRVLDLYLGRFRSHLESDQFTRKCLVLRGFFCKWQQIGGRGGRQRRLYLDRPRRPGRKRAHQAITGPRCPARRTERRSWPRAKVRSTPQATRESRTETMVADCGRKDAASGSGEALAIKSGARRLRS